MVMSSTPKRLPCCMCSSPHLASLTFISEFAGLLSLLQVRLTSQHKFSLPLMCVLSMRGCTLTASSVLPIASGGTLLYGRCILESLDFV